MNASTDSIHTFESISLGNHSCVYLDPIYRIRDPLAELCPEWSSMQNASSSSEITLYSKCPSIHDLAHELEQWLNDALVVSHLDLHRKHTCHGLTDTRNLQQVIKCTKKDPCLDLSQLSTVREAAQGFARVMGKQCQRNVSPSLCQEYYCGSCGCALYPYQLQRLPQDQHIQSPKFLWVNSTCCGSPVNVSAVVCRACFQLYTMVDEDEHEFIRLRRYLFRMFSHAKMDQNQECPPQSFTTSLPSWERYPFAAELRHFKLPSSSKQTEFHSVQAVASQWTKQQGLVLYSLPSSTTPINGPMIQNNCSSITETNVIAKSKTKQLSRPSWDCLLQCQESANCLQLRSKKDEVKKMTGAFPGVSVPKRGSSNLDVVMETEHRSTIRFWLPIHPGWNSHHWSTKGTTARYRDQVKSPFNYTLTIQALQQLEDRFGYEQFIRWLLRVSHWNLALDDVQQQEFQLLSQLEQCKWRPCLEILQFQHLPLRERWKCFTTEHPNIRLWNHPEISHKAQHLNRMEIRGMEHTKEVLGLLNEPADVLWSSTEFGSIQGAADVLWNFLSHQYRLERNNDRLMDDHSNLKDLRCQIRQSNRFVAQAEKVLVDAVQQLEVANQTSVLRDILPGDTYTIVNEVAPKHFSDLSPEQQQRFLVDFSKQVVQQMPNQFPAHLCSIIAAEGIIHNEASSISPEFQGKISGFLQDISNKEVIKSLLPKDTQVRLQLQMRKRIKANSKGIAETGAAHCTNQSMDIGESSINKL